MNVLEKEIEELLFHGLDEDPEKLEDKGFETIPGAKYYRQLNLGAYGIADIVGVSLGQRSKGWREIYIHVIELKKDKVDLGTFDQAMGYARALQVYLNGKFRRSLFNVRISLVGRAIDTQNSFCYLPDIVDNVDLYTYGLDFYQGIVFNRHKGFCLQKTKIPDLGIIEDCKQEIAIKRYYGNMARNVVSAEEIDDLPF